MIRVLPFFAADGSDFFDVQIRDEQFDEVSCDLFIVSQNSGEDEVVGEVSVISSVIFP